MLQENSKEQACVFQKISRIIVGWLNLIFLLQDPRMRDDWVLAQQGLGAGWGRATAKWTWHQDLLGTLVKKKLLSSYLTGPTAYGKITSGPSEAQWLKFDTCNANQCAYYKMLEIIEQGCNAFFPFHLWLKYDSSQVSVDHKGRVVIDDHDASSTLARSARTNIIFATTAKKCFSWCSLLTSNDSDHPQHLRTVQHQRKASWLTPNAKCSDWVRGCIWQDFVNF